MLQVLYYVRAIAYVTLALSWECEDPVLYEHHSVSPLQQVKAKCSRQFRPSSRSLLGDTSAHHCSVCLGNPPIAGDADGAPWVLVVDVEDVGLKFFH